MDPYQRECTNYDDEQLWDGTPSCRQRLNPNAKEFVLAIVAGSGFSSFQLARSIRYLKDVGRGLTSRLATQEFLFNRYPASALPLPLQHKPFPDREIGVGIEAQSGHHCQQQW